MSLHTANSNRVVKMLFTTICGMLFGLPNSIQVPFPPFQFSLPQKPRSHNDPLGMPSLISLNDELATLQALQSIAHQFRVENVRPGSRHTSTGFNRSMDLISNFLKELTLEPRVQEFTSLGWKRGDQNYLWQIGAQPFQFQLKTDFDVMTFSRGGGAAVGVTAPLHASNGCTAQAWKIGGEHQGKIAVVSRGECTFAHKAMLATEAGAAALLIYDSDTGELIKGTLGAESEVTIPVMTITQKLADSFLGNPATILMLYTSANVFTAYSGNLIVDLPGGSAENQIVVGAHLDGVEEGPGINDNGSGAAMILELARVFMLKYSQRTRDVKKIYNQVRLVWFGEEEQGLIGSTYYVNHLSPEDASKTIAMLNFDMLASTNFINGIYSGEEDDQNPVQSSYFTDLFQIYFEDHKIPYSFAALSGGSDYYPFMEKGIPVGGLIAGAGSKKTVQEAKVFGGIAGQPYDPCYHKNCDNIKNINPVIYGIMSKGAAFVLENLTLTEDLRDKMNTESVPKSFKQQPASWFKAKEDVETK